MTAAVLRSSPNLAVPQTQNTAPVFEFNCLYTHDLRRKQKRWQDGFLRYHTFNKRVMVYDVPRNFLGDLHWTSNDDLQEGDEMTLEKGGIMVQVSERIGTIQTDLSDLLQRKDKTPARAPAPSRTVMRHETPHSAATSMTPRTPHGTSTTPMKHKSLNALLGRGRRPIGKASLPTESPFEARNRDVQTTEVYDGRDRKRQKRNSDAQVSKVAKDRVQPAAQTRPKAVAPLNHNHEVIDISSDTEDTSAAQAASHAIEAELLATSSPARMVVSPAHRQVRPNHFRQIETAGHPIPAKQAAVESPSLRNLARKERAVAHDLALVPDFVRPMKETSVPRDTSRKGAAEIPLQKSALFAAEPESQPRGKSLKLVGGAPRKMLLFQSQSARPTSSERETGGLVRDKVQSTRQDTGLRPLRETRESRGIHAGKAPSVDQSPKDNVFQLRNQERLARIAEKQQKRTALQRSNSDMTEQRTVAGKTANSNGLRKTTSVVLNRPNSPDDSTIADFPFPDVTPLDFDDPIVDDSVAKPPTRKDDSGARTSRTISAKSFKPLTVKQAPVAAPVLAARAVQAIAVEERKNEDIGPWSREAFDLMDWRPPDMQVQASETV